MIRLVGPGGAGKSTVGAGLAPIYLDIPARKVETMRPVREVVEEIEKRLG